MKTAIKVILSVILVSLILAQCKKDEEEFSQLSGTVSLADGEIAAGAVVSISDAPNNENVVANSITDSVGKYSFIGIKNGTYYLTAKYEPSNNNNLLKSAGTVILTSNETEVKVSGDVTQDISIVGSVSGGDGKVSLTDGWGWDNTHSTIEFEFPYDAINAVFTGHFNNVGFDVMEFDETNPEATQVQAWVDITSVETGAPSGVCGHGRDGITGCIQGTFGLDINAADTIEVNCEDGSTVTNHPNDTLLVDYDLWGDGSTTTYKKQSAIIGSTGVATFKLKDVDSYGTGYKATADFTFKGVTKEVDFYFNYIEGFQALSRSGNNTQYSSFYGWFKFAAKEDFGVSSGHVGDADITVKISAQFNKTLE